MRLIIEQRVQRVAVGVPHAVEIARGVVAGTEKVGRTAADYAEAVVENVHAVGAVFRAARHVVALFPKRVGHRAVVDTVGDAPYQKPAVVRGQPFERRVEHGVEHEPVVNIVVEHLRVQHCGLAQHRPLIERAFEHLELAAQLGRRIYIERTYEQRVADSRKLVRARTVAVQRHRRYVYKRRRLVRLFQLAYQRGCA